MALDQETTLVGQAAASFAVNWLVEGQAVYPTPDEAQTFIAAYEQARGAPFTRTERESIAAARTCLLAYSARCEHSLAPAVANYRAACARAPLARHGAALFRP